MPDFAFKPIALLILLAVLGCSLLGGLVSRARNDEYYWVSGATSGRAGIGAAIASNWMSAASFLGIAGVFYLKGYLGMAYVVGWTGGYVLLLVLMGNQIRRFGKYTAPEFVEARYDSPYARLIAAIIAILITLVYCTAQYKGLGLVFTWMFGFDYTTSLVLGVVVTLSYLTIAGALGARRKQRMHYAVLIIFFLLPLMVIAYYLDYFWLLPQIGYGEALRDLGRGGQEDWMAPWKYASVYEWIALCFTLMVGTAGLPHVLTRFYTVPNLRDARWSVVWGIFFIGLLYWSAPAYAVFAKIMELRDGLGAAQPADLIVILAAERAGIPVWAVAMLAVGGVIAAISTVVGLLINGAGAFAYDIYFRLLKPDASEQQQMKVARMTTLLLAVLVVVLAINPPGLIAEITAVAFALAGNTLFPVFLLGIWWSRANNYGAIAGMLSGIAITIGSLLLAWWSPELSRFLPPTSSAFIGAPVVALVMVGVSLVTPAPPERITRFLIEKVHQP